MEEFFIHKKDGQLLSGKVIRTYLDNLPDGRFKVTIEKGKRRSLDQNGYYHGVVCQYVKEALRDRGYNEIKTNADAHEILKYRFLKRQIPNEHGEFVEMIGSTKKLTTMEFNAYVEDIVQWVSEEFSIVIPPPNSQAKINY